MRVHVLTVWVVVALVSCPLWAQAAPASGKADSQVLRETVGPAICRVTAENAWGVPLALVTGFAIGDGRFVVTDLGALARKGCTQATLRFGDGTKSVVKEFGMADPALGLVALHTEADAAPHKGRPLAPALPALDGSGQVSSVGWQWADALELAPGRMMRGPTIQTVASRSQVKTPEGVDAFLRVEGKPLAAASGSPVVDANGTVLAVRLEVAAKNLRVALAMPAVSLRQSLLSAEPALKPIAELPEPFWPVEILRMPGCPRSAKEFARATQKLKSALVCEDCRGKGEIAVGGLFRGRDVRCPRCFGTGVALGGDVSDMLDDWAEEGARAVWAPGLDSRSRLAVRSASVDIVTTLSKVGRNFRRLFGALGSLDIIKPQTEAPYGIILYSRIREAVDGPDGSYLLLESTNTRMTVAVRADDLVGHDGMGPTAGRTVPSRRTWFAMAGAVLSSFATGDERGVFVLPFEWTPYIPTEDEERRGPPPPPPGGRGGGWGGGIPGGGRGGGGGGGGGGGRGG